jgi:hypothetical protein
MQTGKLSLSFSKKKGIHQIWNKKKKQKNLDRLAGQPIQIWKTKTKKRPCKQSGLAKKWTPERNPR